MDSVNPGLFIPQDEDLLSPKAVPCLSSLTVPGPPVPDPLTKMQFRVLRGLMAEHPVNPYDFQGNKIVAYHVRQIAEGLRRSPCSPARPFTAEEVVFLMQMTSFGKTPTSFAYRHYE